MSLAILCSGQAGQNREMLDDLLVADDLGDVRDAATRILGRDVADWWRSLDEAAIYENVNAQFSIALYQIAVWRRLSRRLSFRPTVVAGYSLGEVIAWHVAGAMGVADTLQLVLDRARIMDECIGPSHRGGSCMALRRGRVSPSIRLALDEAMARHGVCIAIHRPGGIVLGAPGQAMDAFCREPAAKSGDMKRLPVTVPSHTRWLHSGVERFRDVLATRRIGDPVMPVVSGNRARLQRRGDDAIESLSAQLSDAIRWDWCIETLVSVGVEIAIELGPGNDLSKLLETEQPGVVARAVHEFAHLDDLGEWLAHHAGVERDSLRLGDGIEPRRGH